MHKVNKDMIISVLIFLAMAFLSFSTVNFIRHYSHKSTYAVNETYIQDVDGYGSALAYGQNDSGCGCPNCCPVN